MRSDLLRRVRRFVGSALSSCEAGWIGTAFLLPALTGSLALMFYVESVHPSSEPDMAGFDTEPSDTVAFSPSDVLFPPHYPTRSD